MIPVVVRSSPGARQADAVTAPDGEEKHGEATAEGRDGSRLRSAKRLGNVTVAATPCWLLAGSAAVNPTVRNLGLLLAAAMPFVVGGAAAANFVLVRRSLAVGGGDPCSGRRHQQPRSVWSRTGAALHRDEVAGTLRSR